MENTDDFWKHLREYRAERFKEDTKQFLEFGERLRKAYEKRKRELAELDNEVGNEEKSGN